MKSFFLPDLGEGLAEAIIREWHVKEGDMVNIDDVILTVETAKAVVDIPSPESGMINSIYAKVNDTVKVGAEIISFKTNNSYESKSVVGSLDEDDNIVLAPESVILDNNTINKVAATPAARLFAAQNNIDLNTINNSKSVIEIDDLKNKNINIMCSIMEQAKSTVVPATLCDEAYLYRWSDNEDISARIIQALIFAAQKAPRLNSHFDNKTKSLTEIATIDIGLAIQTDKNLVFPTISNIAKTKSKYEIRQIINKLKEKQEISKSNPSIILSNIGSIAGKFATPVVIPPATTIIATGKIYDKVIPTDGSIKITKSMPISISFDHRGLTGADVAYFLRYFLDDLESANSSCE